MMSEPRWYILTYLPLTPFEKSYSCRISLFSDSFFTTSSLAFRGQPRTDYSDVISFVNMRNDDQPEFRGSAKGDKPRLFLRMQGVRNRQR